MSRFSDPWRFACPYGHRSVVPRYSHVSEPTGKGWYCRTCGVKYKEAEDLKTGRKVTV